MRLIHIRVQAKTEPAYRIITCNPSSRSLQCSCWPDAEFGFCSHIDAALVAGERFMVHPDDREDADFLMEELRPIAMSSDWKGGWRRNKQWRGLARERATATPRNRHLDLDITEADYRSRPTVVFTGQFDVSRDDLEQEAERHGWRCAGSVTDDTACLVAADDKAGSNKLRAASRKGVAILSIDEWRDRLVHPGD